MLEETRVECRVEVFGALSYLAAYMHLQKTKSS